MIDNLISNQLANRKLAPYRLIKKRAESKGTIKGQSNAQLHSNHFIHCISGQTLKADLTLKLNHSLTSQFQNQSDIQNRKINLPKNRKRYSERPPDKMKKQNMKEFTGGFIPKQQKGERNSPAENRNKDLWQGESDREESLTDPLGTNDHQTKNNQARNKNQPPSRTREKKNKENQKFSRK